MKRWAILLLVAGTACLGSKTFAADEVTNFQVTPETNITIVISEEIGAFDGDATTKREQQQQAFDEADNLDQTWKDQLEQLKEPDSNLSLVVDQVSPTDAQHFEFVNPEDSTDVTSVTVDNVDMKDINNLADLGTKSAESYQYKPKLDLPGSGANTYNGDTMQDFAPVPRKYAGEYYGNESQNGFGDENNYRNGLRFTFSKPVDNFGVWVGDVETRTDGEGTPALLRLYDQNRNLILEQVIKPNNIHTNGDQNQSVCGTTNTTTSLINTTGCGHNTTRYVGFTGNMPVVSYMIIIVGDDDAFPGTDENNGNTEHISFMAPTKAFFKLKATPNFESILSPCPGQTNPASGPSICLNLNLAKDAEGELSADDFNLSLGTVTSITKTSNNSFQLGISLPTDSYLDKNLTISLKQDVISEIGNSLSTNLESNLVNIDYQPTKPVLSLISEGISTNSTKLKLTINPGQIITKPVKVVDADGQVICEFSNLSLIVDNNFECDLSSLNPETVYSYKLVYDQFESAINFTTLKEPEPEPNPEPEVPSEGSGEENTKPKPVADLPNSEQAAVYQAESDNENLSLAKQTVISQPAIMIGGLAETGENQAYLVIVSLGLMLLANASYFRFILKSFKIN